MSDSAAPSRDELERLEERLRRLAREKSSLQLVIHLMERVGTLAGLDDTVEQMARLLAETIGGTNVRLYYLIDGVLHYADALGARGELAAPDDPAVAAVLAGGEPVVRQHDRRDAMLVVSALATAWTWTFPLRVGGETVGALKMENLHLGVHDLAEGLLPFFNYAALVLKNEIRGYTRLQRAYDRLAAEVEVRRRTEEELRAVNHDLESFSYSISHDLRAPLRVIDGFVRLLLERHGDGLDAEATRLLDRVRDNAARMGQLIGDILAFSRAGRIELRRREIDMAAVAAEAVEELRPTWQGRQVEVAVAPLPYAWGDPAVIRQVVMNLLANAVKFTRERERAVIEVTGAEDGGERIYRVRDNGAGFDPEYGDKLFGVFQRLHGADRFEGTGIGLAIVKRVIEKHGGRVWADGAVERGATFSFSLPWPDHSHRPGDALFSAT